MGNLRDELIKKGLTSEKKARAAIHEEKARQKRLGPEAVEAERQTREEEARRAEEERRAADREREAERRREREGELERAHIPGLIRAGLVREGVAGNRRFYFVTRESTISFLEVSDSAIRSLAEGRVAIVEAAGIVPRHDFCLVTSEQAVEIARQDAACVRFWNGAGTSGALPRP